jgi:orotidine-5'-phosphate decarboxylase
VSERNFMELISARWDEGKFVCVGLDSDVTKLPRSIAAHRDAQLEFNERIIDATHDLVCAYKPNLAFYASSYGMLKLRQTITFLQEQYPEIPVILDAKQADIGNTNDGYVLEDFIASAGQDFAEAARVVARRMHDEITAALAA